MTNRSASTGLGRIGGAVRSLFGRDRSEDLEDGVADEIFLVVGLGNPGPSYAGNRHNVGQMVLDELAGRVRATFRSNKTRNMVAQARLGTLAGGAPGPSVVLAKPMSYMNVSGGPVSAITKFFKVAPDRIIVVHDEMDIDFGTLKLKIGGGEGGHNGLRDISRALGTKDYLRVRVGVGRPPGRMDPADYVLRDFPASERKELPYLLGEGVDAVEALVTDGLERAQMRFHTR